jgi:hypothetical protein
VVERLSKLKVISIRPVLASTLNDLLFVKKPLRLQFEGS